jgi:poly(3-hydroxybutyrate) depolymerase
MISNRLLCLALSALAAIQIPSTLDARSAGCDQAPALTSGVQTSTLNGKERSYTVRVPENYDETNTYKLIFGYHWLGGTMEDVETGQTVETDTWSYYGLEQLANETVIFVAPQGIDDGWGNVDGEDLVFTDQMLETVESALCVETTQRFATGFSYGGAISYSIACDHATGDNAFRAVAVLSSPGNLSGCK